jgi:hypothetical protein
MHMALPPIGPAEAQSPQQAPLQLTMRDWSSRGPWRSLSVMIPALTALGIDQSTHYRFTIGLRF